MRNRPEGALLAMIVVQLVHAVEEFVFEFWNDFPPMRAVYGDVPGLATGVFVSFHALLLGFGVWCVVQVRRGRLKARDAVVAWIVIQGTTLAVHVAWLVVDPRYQPGLATAPLMLLSMGLGTAALKREDQL
jgi:hypothetical protein